MQYESVTECTLKGLNHWTISPYFHLPYLTSRQHRGKECIVNGCKTVQVAKWCNNAWFIPEEIAHFSSSGLLLWKELAHSGKSDQFVSHLYDSL